MDAGDLLEVLITRGVNVVLVRTQARALRVAPGEHVHRERRHGLVAAAARVYQALLQRAGVRRVTRSRSTGGSPSASATSWRTSRSRGAQPIASTSPVQERDRPGRRVANRRRPRAPREGLPTMRCRVARRRRALSTGHPLGDRRRAERGHDVVGALFVGGIEKLEPGDPARARRADARGRGRPDGRARAAIDAWRPRSCSTCPTSRCSATASGWRWPRWRCRGGALRRGRFPARPAGRGARRRRCPPSPSSARASAPARPRSAARSRGWPPAAISIPIVVAMGRGGPPDPQVAEAGSVDLDRSSRSCKPGARRLRLPGGRPDHGRDHDRRSPGRRRPGGRSVRDQRPRGRRDRRRTPTPGSSILEGSGAALPPVPWDAGVLVVPATCPPEYLSGYLGPYRLLRADLAVVTMSASPAPGSENLSAALRSPASYVGRCAASW